jgi:predicted DNA-binding transcriptional regulator YafY
MNESIYYNVDKIHNAISSNVKISFQYYEWSVSKEIQIKKNGQKYIISPWGLTWDDENYYLIGFDEEESIIKHYRVDKMLNIDLFNDMHTGKEYFENFDTASYIQKTFGMYGGEVNDVDILLENRFIGVVIDRFGKHVITRKQDEDHFITKVKVVISNQFYGWLTGLGVGVIIISPDIVVTGYKEFLKNVEKQYVPND